jgi:hypothetical protein
MTDGHTPVVRRATADYHGHPTYRLDSQHLWLEALANSGPRIVRLGLAGSDRNVLAETPDDGWDTPLGRYELFGGHRLWFAPEDPKLVAVPDSTGLRLTESDRGVDLEGAPEPLTGLVRSISIVLEADAPAVELRHRLVNRGTQPIELAPWSITQLPLGGIAVLPQSQVGDGPLVNPDRLLVMWPYSSWEDERLLLGDDELRVRGAAGDRLKIGTFVGTGYVSYARDGTTLVSRFTPQRGVVHADLGSNVEVFVGDRYIEIEVLGPLETLAPGAAVELAVRWEIVADGDRLGDAG